MGQKYADDDFFLSLYPAFLVTQRAQWRVTVLSAVNGTTYTIEANGTDYSTTADVQSTIPSIRSALRSAINAGTLITAASDGAAILVVKEVVAGSVTAFAVSPEDGLSVEQIVNADKYAAIRAAWLEVAKEWIDLCAWKGKADAGHAALTAHFLAKALGTDPVSGLSTNKINEMRLGPGMVRFNSGFAGGLDDNFFGSTDYGRTYLEMRAALPLTPITDVCTSLCA